MYEKKYKKKCFNSKCGIQICVCRDAVDVAVDGEFDQQSLYISRRNNTIDFVALAKFKEQDYISNFIIIRDGTRNKYRRDFISCGKFFFNVAHQIVHPTRA